MNLRSTVILILSICISLPLFAAKKLSPNKDLEIIARVSANILSREHYRQQEINEETSKQLFEQYFQTLDPGHLYFSQEDIDGFAEQRNQLGQQLLRGNINFAFEVYNLMLEKVEKYRQFVERRIKEDIDLNSEEEYLLDRSKEKWSPEAELNGIWEQRLKNDIIVLRLMQKAMHEEGEEDEKSKVWQQKPPTERVADRITRYQHLLEENEAIDVLELYLASLAAVYDPHSSYMAPASVEDFNIQMKLSLVGIGAVLSSEDGYTKIVRVIKGGPAAKDGRLQPEDRIIAVSQGEEEPVDIIDMPLKKVVRLIRGEKSTVVRLTILEGSKGIQAVPKIITLTRDEVKLTEQEASSSIRNIQLDNGGNAKIGIIELPSFYIDFEAAYQGKADYKSSTRDLKKLLEQFQEEKVDGLIIDLRKNGGGSLVEAINLTGLFIPGGPVVQVKDNRQRIDVKSDTDLNCLYDDPMLVLTNRLSASAAEIFAGAIQDYGRGIIVGDAHTHGKGTVQTILELDPLLRHFGLAFRAGSIKLTSAKFYRINGESTQLRGIVPDIIYPSFTDLMEIGEQHLPHALPWDSIPPAEYKYDDSLSKLIPILRERSTQRRQQTPEFKTLQANIEVYRKIRERKTVLLNEEKRWQSYKEEKKLVDEQTKILRTEANGEDDTEKNDPENDLYLDESVHIMAELIQMLEKPDTPLPPVVAEAQKSGKDGKSIE